MLVLAAALGGAWMYFSQPVPAVDYQEPVSLAARNENSVVATALAVGGITGPLVDITPERVYIAYHGAGPARGGQ